MKRLKFLSTLCLFAMLVFCGSARANGPQILPVGGGMFVEGCPHQMTGTATYAMASAATGTASSVIDLGLVGCIAISITQTGASESVQIWTNSQNNTYTAQTGGTATIWGTATSGNFSLTKVARYMFFLVPANYYPMTITPTATSTSISYWLPTNWPQ
jgi:hypothetical protein